MLESRRGLGVGCLLAWLVPGDAAAQLTQNSTGFAFARVLEVQAAVEETPGDSDLAVTMGAAASDVVDLPDDEYPDDFLYEASVLGSGSVTWGSASGSLKVEASSKPHSSPPLLGFPSEPATNIQPAEAEGQLVFTFEEVGTITSTSLPAGTPVDVVLYCGSSAFGFVLDSLAAPNDTSVGGGAECRIIDETSGFVGAELIIPVNEIQSKTVTSAVGHEIEIRGIVRFVGKAFAGDDRCCGEYLGETEAAIEGTSGLWVGLPAGVSLEGASGHDYTIPVPEPSAPSLALAVLTALRGWRRLRRSGIHPGPRAGSSAG